MSKNKVIIVVAVLALAFGMMACKSSSSGHGGHGKATASGKTINLNGGNASTGSGGSGGDLDIYPWYGLGGIKILKEGEAPKTDFTVPNYPEVVDLGTAGWEVDTSTSVMSYLDDSTVVANQYHTHFGVNTLFQRNAGNTADITITGLKVDKNVTLQFFPNYNNWDTPCFDYVDIYFTNDIEILGTLTVTDLTKGQNCAGTPELHYGIAAIDRDKVALQLESDGKMFIRPSGLISTAGDDATVTNTRGGDGGYMYLWADEGMINEGLLDNSGGDGLGTGDGGYGAIRGSGNQDGLDFETDGTLINKGLIDGSGGDGEDGGGAGFLYLWADGFIFNTGDLNANGGTGSTAGEGGDANYVELETYYGSVYNSGKMLANGGNGGLGGGTGNSAELYSSDDDESVGDIINSGFLQVNGGNALSNGDGGDAGDIYLYMYGGTTQSSGKIEGIGGYGLGTGNTGGAGGDMYVYAGFGYGYWYSYNVQHDDVVISNDIALNGGDGPGGGGDGGDIEIWDEAAYYPTELTAQLKLVGFNKIEGNGGEGASGGGGGGVGAWTYDAVFYTYDECYQYQSAGPIISNTIIDVNGGEGLSAAGGDAGEVYFSQYFDSSDYDYANMDENSYTEISGDILANGGDGVTTGGDGGDIGIDGWYFMKNSARIRADGGVGATGGVGGEVDLSASNREAVNNGGISLNGGPGTTLGGEGGTIYLNGGTRTVNNGNLALRGGDATTTGGEGGEAYLTGTRTPVKNYGTIDVRGGTGTTPGLLGVIFLDMFNVTPTDGTLGF